MENNNKKVMSDEQIETLRMQIALYREIKMENNNEKVMSDEQIERLRIQIALHGFKCDMPADVRNCYLTLQPSLPDLPLPEVQVENTQQEPLTLNGGQRRRWTPTREQIEILESLFKEGKVSYPNKEEIKEIAAVLSQHNQVSDANVYTWFQNRRAQLKKEMLDDNKQITMKKTYRFDHDQLVSTSSYCQNNDDDDDQVESMS